MTEPEFRTAEAPDAPDEAEALAAADGLTVRPGVKEHYEEMTEIGANARGEGRIP